MAKKLKNLFSLFLFLVLLSTVFNFTACSSDDSDKLSGDAHEKIAGPLYNDPGAPPDGARQDGPPGGPGTPGGPPGGPGAPPPGGPGGPGGPPFNAGAPDRAAIYIENGIEKSGNEYDEGKYGSYIKSDENGVTIQNLKLTDGDYSFNGIVATGEKSNVTLDNCNIFLGVDSPVKADARGGSATAVDKGATMHINNSELKVAGAGRYVTSNYGDSKLIINDSSITSTGSSENTTEISEPFSNEPLLIYGTARANFSVGASKTYYFNSTCTTEGWAALSTDAASPEGLDLYAYNSRAVAQNGGYGTYADFFCRVWLYGSIINTPEIGVIISKSGQVVVADGSTAPESVTMYNLGKTTTAGTTITAGRNAVMIHAPDMMGEGKAAADCGSLDIINSTLATTRDLKGKRDYGATYGEALGAYVDFIGGAAILVKSTSANINLENADINSYSGTIAMTVLNSDRMGNFLAEGDADSEKVKPIAISMKNMKVKGDIKHLDYQRIMTLSLDNATLDGMVVSGTMEEWNSNWAEFNKKDCNWLVNDSWNTYYGVRMTVKKGATWNVSGKSTLSSLTIEDGGLVNGNIEVDGKKATPTAGGTYTGKIVVTPI